MKNLATVLLTILIFISIKNYSQEIESGILWVTVISEDTKPINDSITDNSTINSIFSQFGVYSFKQALPFAKTPELLDIYEILCTGDQHQLKLELEQNATEKLIKIKELEVPQLLFNPVDRFWQLQINYDTNYHQNWMWHLQKTEADLAWDITKGSEHIKIAVIDQEPDIKHPDLKTEIYPHYDPYSLKPYHALTNRKFHGTAVCSFAGAETQEFEPSNPDRKLSSMGFNSKLYAYHSLSGSSMEKALHASTVLNADIITISWFSSCSRDTTGYDSTIIKEILDNGTVIVAAAGNGFCSGCYNDSLRVSNCDSIPSDFEHFSTLYPFSENYDDRIITVTGTDSLDYFTYYITDTASHTYNATHSYIPGVDVCAPGHHIMGAAPTLRIVDDDTIPNNWPFSGGCGGTSFATPIVAGLAALIKSINPCFTPEEVQYFIKSTTDTITDGYLYLDEYGNSQTGTGRINAFAAVSLAQQFSNNIDVHIHHNETWTNDTTVNSIFIHPGGQLTIKSNVIFNNITSGIIVDRGGKLIVEGGHLNSCVSIWKGIEVWGNPDTTQNFSGLQGYAELKDSTIIENAEYGIVAYKIGDEDMNYSGGIIRAENTYFINNIQSIGFHPYQNIHPYDPSYEFNNASSFSNCSFIINHPKVYYYYGLADSTITEQWKAFIRLQGVKGIGIRGCYFCNDREINENDTNIKIDDYYTGILSFASGFSVDEHCLVQQYPCDSFQTTKFDRLKYGIRAFSLGKQKAVEIKNSEFTNCKTSIYLGGINNAVITSNVLKLINVDTSDFGNSPLFNKTGIFGGIYLDACSSYKIEENEINVLNGPFQQSQINSIGIVINNSGEEYNEIYNNQIEKLYVGVLAQNQNRNYNGQSGLQIKCNDFLSCEYDIAVTAKETGAEMGIAYYQGSPDNNPEAPANNTFSYTWQNSTSDYHNECEDIIYWHLMDTITAHTKPKQYSIPEVNPQENPEVTDLYNKQINCPSSFNNGGGGGIEENRSAMLFAEQKIDSIQDLLNILVDGGNTDGLDTDVQTSLPNEAYELRNNLLSKSPYLSDTIMVSAVKKEGVLPPTMVTEILSANPQSAKSDTIQIELNNRINQLSSDQRIDIDQGWFVISAKESLEAKLSYYKAQQSNSLNNIIKYFRKDTISPSPCDSIINLLENENTLWSKYALAFEHLAIGNNANVLNVLNTIPDNFNLTTKQIAQHQLYENYFNILIQLRSQNKSIFNLDSIQKSTLYTILNSSTGILQSYIRNTMIITDTLTYNEPYILPGESLKSGKIRRIPIRKTYNEDNFRLYPNPTGNYVIIDYTMKTKEREGIIQFIDNSGKLVRNILLSDNRDYIVVSLKNFPNGVYIVKFVVGNKILEAQKLIINQ